MNSNFDSVKGRIEKQTKNCEKPKRHSAMCREYWDRGLECRCVPDWVNEAIRAGAKPEDVM